MELALYGSPVLGLRGSLVTPMHTVHALTELLTGLVTLMHTVHALTELLIELNGICLMPTFMLFHSVTLSLHFLGAQQSAWHIVGAQ